MNADTVAKQIETYSNAIVGFAVLQGLAYCYTFGSNALFNCVVRTAPSLAISIVIGSLVLMLLLLAANWALGAALARIAGEYARTVRRLYVGKAVVIALFTLVPAALTYAYGVNNVDPDLVCRSPPAPAKS